MGRTSREKERRKEQAENARRSKGIRNNSSWRNPRNIYHPLKTKEVSLEELRKNWRGRYFQIRKIVKSMLPEQFSGVSFPSYMDEVQPSCKRDDEKNSVMKVKEEKE